MNQPIADPTGPDRRSVGPPRVASGSWRRAVPDRVGGFRRPEAGRPHATQQSGDPLRSLRARSACERYDPAEVCKTNELVVPGSLPIDTENLSSSTLGARDSPPRVVSSVRLVVVP